MKKKSNSGFWRILIALEILVVVVILAGITWTMWGKEKYAGRKQEKLVEELSEIYDATMTYSDPKIDEIYQSAQNITDSEAKYHSLWFLDTLKDGEDDAFIAVFEKENGDMNIYISYSNPAEGGELSWEKKEIKASDEPLTTWLPKQMKNKKKYASFAIRCDGITEFE